MTNTTNPQNFLSKYKEQYDRLEIKKNLRGKKALDAVKINPFILTLVEEQTEAICIAAVKQNPVALQYVESRFFEYLN